MTLWSSPLWRSRWGVAGPPVWGEAGKKLSPHSRRGARPARSMEARHWSSRLGGLRAAPRRPDVASVRRLHGRRDRAAGRARVHVCGWRRCALEIALDGTERGGSARGEAESRRRAWRLSGSGASRDPRPPDGARPAPRSTAERCPSCHTRRRPEFAFDGQASHKPASARLLAYRASHPCRFTLTRKTHEAREPRWCVSLGANGAISGSTPSNACPFRI